MAGAFLLVFLGLIRPGLAERVDGRIEAAVQLKALNYDRALKKRNKPTKLVIAVLYKQGGDSEKVQKEMVAAFREMAKQIKIQGLTVHAVPVLYQPEALARDLEAVGANVVYLAPGLEGELAKIHAVALARKAATLCSDRELVKRGVALGVFLNKKKTGIAVNVKVARELGMDLDSSLFSVAEVFK